MSYDGIWGRHADSCECGACVEVMYDQLKRRITEWEYALHLIADGKNRSLLLSMKPGGEWTTRDEVYENIARAALDPSLSHAGSTTVQ